MNYREPIHDIGPIDKLHEVNCNVSSVITSPTHLAFKSYYRPQTKFAKVMSLHVSVILSTRGGGVPQCMLGCTPPPPSTRGRHPPRSSACWEIWATSGQYASYWNAFLLLPANKVWGKVIFLHLFVILFTGGGSDPGVSVPRGGLVLGGPPSLHPRGKLRGIRSRPTPKGELRRIRSRPTPKGEIEGDQIQAHTQGGN